LSCGPKASNISEISDAISPRYIRKNPRSMYARVPHMMAQFVLKIEKLSHIIGTAPILEIARAYGLRPRLWLLVIYETADKLKLTNTRNYKHFNNKQRNYCSAPAGKLNTIILNINFAGIAGSHFQNTRRERNVSPPFFAHPRCTQLFAHLLNLLLPLENRKETSTTQANINFEVDQGTCTCKFSIIPCYIGS